MISTMTGDQQHPGYGAAGKPARYLFTTSRIVHAYAIAYLTGRPGADIIIDHGMNFLWNSHRDSEYGGYIGVSAMMDRRIQPSRATVTPLFSRPPLAPRSQAIQKPIDSSPTFQQS
jgi:N-acylglucosamine 2-epimerase (GlcNAc 2-epimerase)